MYIYVYIVLGCYSADKNNGITSYNYLGQAQNMLHKVRNIVQFCVGWIAIPMSTVFAGTRAGRMMNNGKIFMKNIQSFLKLHVIIAHTVPVHVYKY